MAERSLDLKPFLFGALVGSGIALVEKKFPQAEYKTYPSIPLKFKAADKALEFSFMRFIGVFSHHWHWENREYNPEFETYGLYLPPAPSGNLHTNVFSGVIAHLGGRSYGYVVGTEVQPYFIGFRHMNSDQIRRCKLELNKPVMLLAAPDDGCIVYAIDKDNRPLKILQRSGLIHRRDKPSDIRIL